LSASNRLRRPVYSAAQLLHDRERGAKSAVISTYNGGSSTTTRQETLAGSSQRGHLVYSWRGQQILPPEFLGCSLCRQLWGYQLRSKRPDMEKLYHRLQKARHEIHPPTCRWKQSFFYLHAVEVARSRRTPRQMSGLLHATGVYSRRSDRSGLALDHKAMTSYCLVPSALAKCHCFLLFPC